MTQLRKRLDHIEDLARIDSQYQRMLREMAILEKRYFDVLKTLSVEQRDTVSDFVSQCEA